MKPQPLEALNERLHPTNPKLAVDLKCILSACGVEIRQILHVSTMIVTVLRRHLAPNPNFSHVQNVMTLKTGTNTIDASILVLCYASNVHLIWSISETQRPHVCIRLGQESILTDTHTSVCLDGAVDYFACHVRHHYLLRLGTNPDVLHALSC